jgi:hypothetical protein
MIYGAVLLAHIFTAIVTGGVILYTLFAVAKGHRAHYKLLALLLAGVAAVEVASGISLIFVSPTATPLSVALHMTAYLSVCAGVEVLLYVASRYRPA